MTNLFFCGAIIPLFIILLLTLDISFDYLPKAGLLVLYYNWKGKRYSIILIDNLF